MFAGHVLPDGLPLMLAEGNRATGFCFGQENAPTVLRHLHIAECRPALGIDGNRCSQINVRSLEAERSELAPPAQKTRLPLLKRALQAPVPSQIYVIGN